MNKPVFIIAEAGVNHNGSIDLGLQLVDAAADLGANAVKFQTFKAAKLVTAKAPKADYQSEHTEAKESQLEMLQRLELDYAQHEQLIARCRERAIEFISTPFDLDSLELLVALNVRRIKISSGELTNAPLLLAAARAHRPIILSTGLATLDEVRTALSVLAFGYSYPDRDPSIAAFREHWHSPEAQEILRRNVTLLHCTTEYPAPFEETNLLAMDTLRDEFNLSTGLSDHTPGVSIAVAAAARHASVIEKHLTLDRALPGPDHQASLIPQEFRRLVTEVRQVEQALGSPLKAPTPSETRNISIVRKSLVAAEPIQKGDRFTDANLTAKRPGNGLPPTSYWDYLGRISIRDYQADEPILPQ